VKTVNYLRSQNKQIIFVTNNSTKSRRTYTQKFSKLGIEVSEDEIFSSSYSAAIYLSRVLNFPKDKLVYVLGERGVEDELETEGISFIGGTDPSERLEITEEDFNSIRPDENVGAVLCGLDQHISYKKLSRALMYLRQKPEVYFIATNMDSTFPTHGALFPGAGACTAVPLEYSSKRRATVCGKPSQTMMDAIRAKYDFDKKRTCMVGDRLETDIQFGIQGGLGGTLLVLTGIVTSVDDCEKKGISPSYVIHSLGDLSVLAD